MLSTIIFLSILIIVLSIMLMIDVNINIDANRYKLLVYIRIYGIRIIKVSFDVLGLYYTINNSKKQKAIDFLKIKEQEYLIKQIKSSILDKLYYDRVLITSCVNAEDPAICANIVGGLNLICYAFYYLLYAKNEDIEYAYNVFSDFDKQKFLNKLESENKAILWITKEYRRETGLSKEKFGDFYIDKTVLSVGYFEAGKFVTLNLNKTIEKNIKTND